MIATGLIARSIVGDRTGSGIGHVDRDATRALSAWRTAAPWPRGRDGYGETRAGWPAMSGNTSSQWRRPRASRYPRVSRSGADWGRPRRSIQAAGWITPAPGSHTATAGPSAANVVWAPEHLIVSVVPCGLRDRRPSGRT